MKHFLILALALFSFAFVANAAPNPAPQAGADAVVNYKGKKVKPCDHHANADGVMVENYCSSKKNIYVDPKTGTAGSKTTVKVESKVNGKILGIDSNDIVNAGNDTKLEISGSGGTINMSNGSTAFITNAAGGPAMTVNLPSGTTLHISPGSSLTVNT